MRAFFSVRPQVVIHPKDQNDIETVVQILAKEAGKFPSLSLTPRAAGTGLSGGSLTDSIVIDVTTHLHSMGKIVKKKVEITFSCQPGAMWRDVEKQLKKHHVYLPSYPASKDICSMGGAVGTMLPVLTHYAMDTPPAGWNHSTSRFTMVTRIPYSHLPTNNTKP